MPGRLRTASRPSRTVIALASYPPLPDFAVVLPLLVVPDGGVLARPRAVVSSSSHTRRRAPTVLPGGSLQDAGVPGTGCARNDLHSLPGGTGPDPLFHTASDEAFRSAERVALPAPGDPLRPRPEPGPPGLSTVISRTMPSPRSAANRPSIAGPRNRSCVAQEVESRTQGQAPPAKTRTRSAPRSRARRARPTGARARPATWSEGAAQLVEQAADRRADELRVARARAGGPRRDRDQRPAPSRIARRYPRCAAAFFARPSAPAATWRGAVSSTGP